MDASNRFPLPKRNPRTHARHRREVFWQITVPLLLGVLLLVAALVVIIFSATQPVTDLGRWAGVSLIWLIMPSLFIALIALVILVGFIYLISLLLHLVPRYALILQLYFEQVKGKVSQLSNRVIEPLVKASSIWAVLRRVGRWGNKGMDEH